MKLSILYFIVKMVKHICFELLQALIIYNGET